MKSILSLVFLASFGLCSAQSDCFGEGLPNNPQPSAVSKGADNFAIKLFTDVATKYPFNSIVISPYSVWSVLILAYFGANGVTETQLQTALGVPSKSDAFYGGKVVEARLRLNEGTIFNKADKAYFAEHVELHSCAINKLTELEKVDFQNSTAAAKKINTDVSLATKGKINNFLSPSVIQGATFVLLNAVYFKGLWTFPFIESRTLLKPFFDETGSVNISSATMMSTQAKLKSAASPKLKSYVLELPYENSNISMLIILPNAGETTVNDVLKQLTSDILDEVTNDFGIRTTVVTLPKFKMTTRIADELKTGLRNLGVTDLFEAGKADLSNFVVSEKPFVSDSLHHATIEVTEEGTIASAATALIGTRSGENQLFFNADRPFIFLIRDVSQGLTLFIGVLRNPNQTTPF